MTDVFLVDGAADIEEVQGVNQTCAPASEVPHVDSIVGLVGTSVTTAVEGVALKSQGAKTKQPLIIR